MALIFSFQKLPVDESGAVYASMREFKTAQIKKLLLNAKAFEDDKVEMNLAAATAIVANQSLAIEILEINENSLPSARGKKRPRKPKPAVATEQAA